MTASDNRKKGFRPTAGRFALVVPLMLITSFAWISFSHENPDMKSVSDESISDESDPPQAFARTIAKQSIQTSARSEATWAPVQLDDPKKDYTSPEPERREPKAHESPETKKDKKVDRLVMPEWKKIFNSDGSFKDEVNNFGARSQNGVADYVDIYNGTQANFIQDNISNGLATDMSALLSAAQISDEVLYNGEVSSAHDLGNSYFLATESSVGHKRVYLGIERLFVPVDSYIEVEFNQGPVQLGSGTNWWKISGDRTFGDLLVRMNFSKGRLSFVEFELWEGNAYSVLETYNGSPGKGCVRQAAFIYCGGAPPIAHPLKDIELWDANFNRVKPTPPDDFVQLGIDLMQLTGVNLKYNGILIRTPEDIVINGFYMPGQFAYLDAPWALNR